MRFLSAVAKFLMSVSNWKVKFSSNFESFFILMTHNCPVIFKLIQSLLWIKGPNKSPENLPNSSCHLRKYKSVFLQILHQFSMLWNIILFYTFFSSNIIYFGQKQPIKVEVFEIFEWWSQKSSNSSCQFRIDKLSPLQICIIVHSHDA